MRAGESAIAYSLSFSRVELERLKSRDIFFFKVPLEPRAERRWRGVCGEVSSSLGFGTEGTLGVARGPAGAEVCEISERDCFAVDVGGFWAVWARCSGW
jgi:hypothetical protein